MRVLFLAVLISFIKENVNMMQKVLHQKKEVSVALRYLDKFWNNIFAFLK